MGAIRNIRGRRFGRLIVVIPTERRRHAKVIWECLCDCGATHFAVSRDLIAGHVKSCGCLLRDKHPEIAKMGGMASRTTTSRLAILRNTKHGNSSRTLVSREYKSWAAAKGRCASREREYYAGRGIKMCDRWQDSFADFLADMGPRPKGTTLDRWPNNDGDYEPGNCRWATPKQQANNRRAPRKRKTS